MAAHAAVVSEQLGWDVIQASTQVNRVVSPSSLCMSLAQAAEGAQGESLESIDAALGLSGDERSEAFVELRESLVKYDSLPESVDADDPPETPVVHQASRILAIDAEIEGAYLDRIEEYFDATSDETTLGGAKADLDAWANKHTAGLIEKSAVDPTEDTVAVLQDALIFAAAWRKPFKTELPIAFTTADGAKQVDGVTETLPARYAEGDGWAAVRLAYDDQLAADVILPVEGVAASELTADHLHAAGLALAEAPEELVRVSMPTFDLAVEVDLLNALPSIDLTDLGGIYEGAEVGDWVQQAKLIVTARGTVGAALTEMMVMRSSLPTETRVFTVDRPYVFRVLDTATGWPLFLAAVADPSQS